MSNIFEIDGDIEDNNEDSNKKPSEINSEEESHPQQNEIENDSESEQKSTFSFQVDEVEDGLTEEEEERIAYEKAFGAIEEDKEEESAIAEDEFITEIEEEEQESDIEPNTYIEDDADSDDESDSEEDLEIESDAINEVEVHAKDNEEKKESFDDIFPPKTKGKNSSANLTMVFAVLFIISFSILCYYQFYDGNSFSLNFIHKDSYMAKGRDSLSVKAEKAKKENEVLRKKVREMTEAFNKLKLAAQANSLDAEGNTVMNQNYDTGIDLSSGTVYQIQISALQSFNLQSDSDLRIFIDEDNGLTKLMVGAFNNENEALEFAKDMKKGGFSDAFVVKKIDGNRVPYNPYK